MLCQFLLYNKVNQLYVYIYPHISSLLSLPPTLPIPPLQVVTKHGADLPVLCSCFPLAIYLFYIWQCIYVNTTLSLRPSLPFPLSVSSSPFSTSESLFLSCSQFLHNHFFFFYIPYICVSIQYLFFSFRLTSLCMTDSRSIHLTTNNSISFFFNIFIGV